MSRSLRIEFAGALYHVMARGDARAAIFLDEEDRQAFCAGLAHTGERVEWRLWDYCLMDNHEHLLVETLQPTLSRGMREVNGVYTQAFNRRHGRVGHVLQGSYKAVLVDKDRYLRELSRYIVLNPERAHLCETAGDWPWSSYRAVMRKLLHCRRWRWQRPWQGFRKIENSNNYVEMSLCLYRRFLRRFCFGRIYSLA